MFKNALEPGTKAPTSGGYWVHHYQHRVAHAVRIEAGEVLPMCGVCGDRVRFEPAIGVDHALPIGEDKDFAPSPGERLA